MVRSQRFICRPDAEAPFSEQQQETVAIAGSKKEVVQHHDDNRASIACFARQALQHRHLMRQIEMLQRLVEQIDRRPLRAQRRCARALALATGERHKRAVAEATQMHRFDLAFGNAFVLHAPSERTARVRVAPEQDVVAHAAPEFSALLLQKDADLPGQCASWHGADHRILQHDIACLRPPQCGKRVQESGLAAAVAAEHRPHLTRQELDRQSVDEPLAGIGELQSFSAQHLCFCQQGVEEGWGRRAMP